MIRTIARQSQIIAINSNNIEVIIEDYASHSTNVDNLIKDRLNTCQTIGYTIFEQVLIESAAENCNIVDLLP